ACLRIGAVYVPINTANTDYEVGYFLQHAQPRLAIVRPGARAALAPVAAAAGVPRLETLGADGEGSIAVLARRNAGATLTRPGLKSDALAAILYTSGTTGRSKGA